MEEHERTLAMAKAGQDRGNPSHTRKDPSAQGPAGRVRAIVSSIAKLPLEAPRSSTTGDKSSPLERTAIETARRKLDAGGIGEIGAPIVCAPRQTPGGS